MNSPTTMLRKPKTLSKFSWEPGRSKELMIGSCRTLPLLISAEASDLDIMSLIEETLSSRQPIDAETSSGELKRKGWKQQDIVKALGRLVHLAQMTCSPKTDPATMRVQ